MTSAFPFSKLRPVKNKARRLSTTGSLTRRMIVVSTIWILLLLGGGGFALDRVLTAAVTRNFDAQLEYVLTALLATAEIGPDGEVSLNRPPADQRFLEPYSGAYFQISGTGSSKTDTDGFLDLPSRSLWDRRLKIRGGHRDFDVHTYDSNEFPDEVIRVVERDARLPGSPVRWRFQVAESRAQLDEQISVLRKTLIRSFAILGLGLVILAALQASPRNLTPSLSTMRFRRRKRAAMPATSPMR
jgi:hypothetical protein